MAIILRFYGARQLNDGSGNILADVEAVWRETDSNGQVVDSVIPDSRREVYVPSGNIQVVMGKYDLSTPEGQAAADRELIQFIVQWANDHAPIKMPELVRRYHANRMSEISKQVLDSSAQRLGGWPVEIDVSKTERDVNGDVRAGIRNRRLRR